MPCLHPLPPAQTHWGKQPQRTLERRHFDGAAPRDGTRHASKSGELPTWLRAQSQRHSPAGPEATGTHAYPPGHEGVGFLQRGGVQLKQRGDVVAVGHSHKAVLDFLPSVSTTWAALHTLGEDPSSGRSPCLLSGPLEPLHPTGEASLSRPPPRAHGPRPPPPLPPERCTHSSPARSPAPILTTPAALGSEASPL